MKFALWHVLSIVFGGILIFLNQVGVGNIPHRALSYSKVIADLPYTFIAGSIIAYGFVTILKK